MPKNMITVEPAGSDDITFAKNIVLVGMSSYYEENGIDWSDVKFEEAWKLNSNFIIFIERKRVGYFAIKIEKGILYIRDLHVLKDYRYKGVGRYAMNFILNQLQATDIAGVRLKVFKSNDAVKFYEKFNFTSVFSDQIFFGMEYVNLEKSTRNGRKDYN